MLFFIKVFKPAIQLINMAFSLTVDAIIIFAALIIFVFLIYRLFTILLKGALVAAAGFSFPWIIQYLNLPLNIAANMETGLEFAMIALAIFLIYEFFHFIKYFFRILAWPFKALRRRK